MNDLIRREDVLALFPINDCSDKMVGLYERVLDIPTAYDVSKVEEELEENKQWYETHGCNVDLNVGVISATNHAIDVVRKGGVE